MNNELQQFDKEHVWHPFDVLCAENICIESAVGIYLYTPEGRPIMDAISSWWVNLHGHSEPTIAQAIYEQALKLEQVIFAGFTHPQAVQLAQSLLKILPFEYDQIFYSDNGSTSVEVALKLAMQYWHNQGIEKKKVVALEGAYHGDTFGAMAVGERNVFSKPFNKYLFEVEVLYHHSQSEKECIARFEKLVAAGEVGAFIYEPLIQGAAGMKIYSATLLQQLLEIAQKYEVVTIADEVMTGFGRTGQLFASAYMSIGPDMICMSKGITGGFLPLGATAINKKIVSPFDSADKDKRFYHGHSYTANPLSCAAANASMRLLLSDDCQQQIKMIEQSHLAFLENIKSHPQIVNAAVLGTILSIELHAQGGTSYFSQNRDYLYQFFLQKNILLRPLGNVIYILPPYVIKSSELQEIYTAIMELLDTL